ncbi:MAG: hypothetical protein JWN69_2570 [Alphaproteobacteria bacterium]|nr:hypothetical protein [Alphaproteobacteria bacterium]
MLFFLAAANSPLRGLPHAAPHTQGLIELGRSVGARIGGVEQQMNVAAARRRLDLLAARDQCPGARLEAQPVEQGLAQRRLDSGAEILGNGKLAGLERPRQSSLEAPLRLRLVERGAVDADPGAAARSARTHVGRDAAVGAEREPDQRVASTMRAGEHAFAFRLMSIALMLTAVTPTALISVALISAAPISGAPPAAALPFGARPFTGTPFNDVGAAQAVLEALLGALIGSLPQPRPPPHPRTSARGRP